MAALEELIPGTPTDMRDMDGMELFEGDMVSMPIDPHFARAQLRRFDFGGIIGFGLVSIVEDAEGVSLWTSGLPTFLSHDQRYGVRKLEGRDWTIEERLAAESIIAQSFKASFPEK
jgi:hypothetical protein